LCGKWPDIGLWGVVLSLGDRNGIVDVTPAYLARVTGLAIDDVVGCMQRFCEPDPYSRSTAENGARLVRLDPDSRDWGWRIVNHGKYREKARLVSKNEREVVSGENAARLRGDNKTAEDRRSPPKTAAHRPSYKTKQDKSKNTTPIPDDLILTDNLSSYITSQIPDCDPTRLIEQYRDQALAKDWRYANWISAFKTYVRNIRPDSGHWSSGQYPRKTINGGIHAGVRFS
jgi:hypothetical protein